MSHTPIARKLRGNATDAEQRLWSHLRSRQLHGLKFRRQALIANYIADFVSIEARLVIELDGSQHLDQTAADRARTDAIESAGHLVIRFWNDDVLNHTDAVLEEIARTAALRSTP